MAAAAAVCVCVCVRRRRFRRRAGAGWCLDVSGINRLVPRQVTLMRFTARQGRRSQGVRRRQGRPPGEERDAASGVHDRRERGKRCLTRHTLA